MPPSLQPSASSAHHRAPQLSSGMRSLAVSSLLLRTILLALPVVQAHAQTGFPNVQRPAAEASQIAAGQAAHISGPWAPGMGRLSVIAYHQGWVFTIIEAAGSLVGFDGLERAWDLSNPANLVQKASWDASYNPGFTAHGSMQSGTKLISATMWNVPTFRQEPIPAPVSVGTSGLQGGSRFHARGGLYSPWFAEMFWSYGDTNHTAKLYKNNVLKAEWDHVAETGVIGHPIIIGNLLIYASDTTHTGVATYDISDPTQPRLLDVFSGDVGGYFPEVWGHYVVFTDKDQSSLKVVDFEDPTNLRMVANIPTPSNPPYVQFQDEFAFAGAAKVNMRTFQTVLTFDDSNVGMNQYLLPLGNLVLTGGSNLTNGGLHVWSHQVAPDTRPPTVEYHIPTPDQTNYPVGAPISLLIHETLDPTTVNATNILVRYAATHVPIGIAQIVCAHNDVITIQPSADLAANTTYEVVLVDGGIKDASGNGIAGYTFRFSTGSLTGGNQPPASVTLTSNVHPVAPGGSVTFTASATDPESQPLQYLFDFGDGIATPWGSTSSAAHTYAAAGHYTAKVKVRDAYWAITTKTMVVTVITTPGAPFPTRSTPVTLAASGNVWGLNPDRNTACWVNSTTFSLGPQVWGTGLNQRSLAVAADGTVWIVSRDNDRIVIVSGGATDGATLLKTITLPYGSVPEAIAMSPDKTKAFVTLSGSGKLLRFNTATRVQDSQITLGPTPHALAVAGDASRVLVTRFVSPADRGEVWSVPHSAAGFGTPVVIPLVLDPGPDSLSGGRGVPNYLTAIAITPDGQRAWVAAKKDNVNRGGFMSGEPNTQDNTVRSMVAVLDLTTNTEIMGQRRDIDNSEGPSAICFSALGDYAFVALRGSNNVAIYDVLAPGQGTLGATSLIGRLGVSSAPDGLYIDDSQRLWVRNFMDRSLSIINLDEFFRSGSGISYATTAPVKTVMGESLTTSVLKGKRLFYGAGGFQLEGGAPEEGDFRMSAEGYISCATCHLDGGSDQRVWDFTNRGEGLRNTIPLWGRNGTGQGNVHWTGNFDEIQDFEHDIRGAFGGTGFLTDFDPLTDSPLGLPKAGRSADLDALANYVASLGPVSIPRSPFRNTDGSLSTAALAGQTVFASNGCASCHSGSQFTESTVPSPTLRNVGTIKTSSGQRLGQPLPGFDTPTLLGLAASAPYLHDGSAPTLDAVFNAAGSVILQAENATLGGTSTINASTTAHAGNYARLVSVSNTLTFTAINGGSSGGAASIALRYSAITGDKTVKVTVNGVLTTVLAPKNNSGNTFDTWGTVSVNVTLTAGATNTVVVGTNASNIAFDDLTVVTAGDLAAASAHRSVPAGDRANLVAYLLSLDGSDLAGLKAEFFDFTTPLTDLPDLTGLTPTVTRTDAKINYPSSSAAWAGLDPALFADTFALRHTGRIYVPEDGTYTLYLGADEGAKLWLDGTLTIDHGGSHTYTEKASAALPLTRGWHPLRVEYYENTGVQKLTLTWQGPGMSKGEIPATAFAR